MISLIVPTRNGAQTLGRVAPSFFSQDDVDEIVFVDDAGNDDSAVVLAGVAAHYPHVRWHLLRLGEPVGSAEARNQGAWTAHNQFLLFCRDDEFLAPGYARTCLDKLVCYGAGAVAGRHLEMREGESPAQAVLRFGHGPHDGLPFRPLRCESVDSAWLAGDLRQPCAGPAILTRRDLVLRHPFDPFYGPGERQREDTDFQLGLFVHGHDIWVANDCHCVRLPASRRAKEDPGRPGWRRVADHVRATRHLFRKYYAGYARRLKLPAPRLVALAVCALSAIHGELLGPQLHRAAEALRSKRARWRHASQFP